MSTVIQQEDACITQPVITVESQLDLTTKTNKLFHYMRNQLTTGIAKNSTVYQSHKSDVLGSKNVPDNILSSLVLTIAVLVIGIICIRMLYSKIMKGKDLHSGQNVTTTDNSVPCVDRDPHASSQQVVESNDINCHPLSTVSQKVDEEMGNSKQRQQKNYCKTLMFEFPKSLNDATSRGRKMQSKLLVSQVPAYDKDLYANQVDLTYTNKSFRADSPMDK